LEIQSGPNRKEQIKEKFLKKLKNSEVCGVSPRVREKLIEFLWWMKNKAIKNRQLLSVKEVMATCAAWSESFGSRGCKRSDCWTKGVKQVSEENSGLCV